jgi:hypothetical protein
MTFESALEAFTERSAIMEYDGGLPRREAVFRAFELCFPGDYRECMRIAAGIPDGETALYEYLEGLIKPSRTHEEGSRTHKEAKNVKSYVETKERPSTASYEGLQGLKYMTAHGIPLIGVYQSGAMLGKQEPENFTTDAGEIAALMAGKGDREGRAKGSPITRFYFIPADAGLLCLDIDRKPGKPDGLQELYNLFPRDTLPRALQDIDLFFPCYVSTPSGGYHLYFKYKGPPVKKTDLAPEVEIKHGKPGLTAPGSRKENGDYILHGDLAAAPPLYGIILDRIAALQKQLKAADKPAPWRAGGNPGKQWNPRPRITLDTLADESTAAAAGNHDRQVSFAGRACRCKFPYRDALAYVQANSNIFGNGADTENTIKSVYQDRGAI